ncbi:Na(+)-translocating NADH-quinone reductase subunit F [Flaviramulus sp. BrNp1-15]|uniref:Na(+)-translocating NADH-quinone reductase subunit F n=1 Tax=Flaviramulus sp. BrNp1-15 TaxID=2916754 RepID=UPI001EE8BAB5|nr:Na(+)-translocating NADH-quinone reductase subunit F [Flaviramulus sp. BrNp1-15]ULC60457.1 Na(+)-translocating NADH-quinone reductase subunit F [Flaviramulus sp. BrNp1-15]
MKTTSRLEQAIKKLYIAFHSDKLHPECCMQCAVGNILDNKDSWKHLADHHGTTKLNYVGKVHQNLGRKFNGYSPLELLQIEAIFLKACGYKLPLHYRNTKPENPTDKNVQFNGLCAVIVYLCELDGINNIMDYSKLFEFENNKPKYQLAI